MNSQDYLSTFPFQLIQPYGVNPNFWYPILQAMKTQTPNIAKEFLAAHYPQFDHELRDALLAWNREYMAMEHELSTVPFAKNKFYMVAWLLGASWGQLAGMFDVSRATVASSVRAILPPTQRQAVRLNNNAITLEQLSSIKAAYLKMYNIDSQYIQRADVITIAKAVRVEVSKEEYNDDESSHDAPYLYEEPSPIPHVEQPSIPPATEPIPADVGKLGDDQLDAIAEMFGGKRSDPDDEPSDEEKKMYGIE